MASNSILPPLLRGALGVALLGLVPLGAMQAQGAVISGTVTVEGQPQAPLAASVLIQEINLATVADAEGRFVLRVPTADMRNQTVRITARYIGYLPQTKTVTLTGGAMTLDFALTFDPFRLSDVVVTGTADGQARNKIPFSVSVVNESQLRDVPASSPVAALAGKVAGARIALGTGNPGSSPAIRLRGSTNLGVGGSSPLIIVDGVITRFSIADIDAQDIASVEVLKGAAASAFYGSDAANGVLSITTKRGKDVPEGTVRMSVRTEYGTTSLNRFVPLNQSHHYMLNPDGTIMESSPGTRVLDPDGLMDNPYPSTGVNQWRNQLKTWLPDGDFYSTNFQLGFRRGGTNLATSFTTDHNGGVVPFRSGQFRQSARVNVDQQINSKLDFGSSLTYSLSNNDYGTGSSEGWFALLQSPPDVDLRNPNNDPTQVEYFPVLPGFVPNARGNPLYSLRNGQNSFRRERMLGSATLRYRPLEWLRVEGSYGTDRSNRRSESYDFKGYLTSGGVPGDGSLAIGYDGDVAENMQFNAIATRVFGELLSTTRVTYLVEKQTSDGLDASGNNLAVFGVQDLDVVPPDNNSIGSSRSRRGTINYFVSQAFDWKDKYIADFLVRRDGSSLFGADKRWANFYRVAGAWRFSEEFDLPGIQEGRLRYARGTAGLRPGFSDQYETYSLSNGNISKSQLGNPNLEPAVQTEDEFGVNLTFLDRFDAELVYAKRLTEGAFLSVPLSLAQSGGFTNQVQNAADVSANTVELSLSARVIDRQDLSYSVTLVGDRTRQRIDRMDRAPFRVNAGGQGQDVFYYKEGEVLGVIYGQRWVRNMADISAMGLDPALYSTNSDGYVVLTANLGTLAERPVAFVDADGNNTVKLGDVNPDFSWGLSQNLRWKGLAVYALIDGVQGGDIYNFTKQWMYQDLRHGSIDQAKRPVADRRPFTFYSAGLYNGLVANSHFVENGTYARLRELSVAYNFNANMLSRVGLGAFSQGLKLSIVGRNLLTWTNYTGFDPEANSGGDFNFRIDGFRYPNFRTITAMIDVSF
ncbi:MAG: SusC/RagA family TonB-linked outer membrane protein [Gemmatimonadales bacterium]|nr:SusC/RagA family TonB-linked outer membrane protein [Gemmatimonadota bacterium]MCL4214149.1 SusC/RagA family TonB-linked outer membrane protein [Gemmatimonadales bacterium]